MISRYCYIGRPLDVISALWPRSRHHFGHARPAGLADDIVDHVTTQTNAEGRAEIIVGNEGLNIIAAHAVQPVTGNPDVTELGLFTSLTLVGAEHAH